MVGPKGGEGGPRHVREEMPAQKSDIWRGGLTLGGKESREVLVRNSKLRTVDRPIEPVGMVGEMWRQSRGASDQKGVKVGGRQTRRSSKSGA